MSGTLPAHEPECFDPQSPSVELIVEARPREVGGFAVRRALPSMRRRLVGPFIFFDHVGPAELRVGDGIDVRPHPHIELATVTYLFDGEIDHRDSLGTLQTIRAGDVNWMMAGSGIVHSERSGPESRKAGVRIHGIQCWVALPLEHQQTAPRFEHHPAASIPRTKSTARPSKWWRGQRMACDLRWRCGSQASDTSTGTSSPARKSASNERNKTGTAAVSRRCRETKWNTFHCPID